MVELVVALAVTLVTAPLVRRLLVATDVLDVPNARSSHDVPVARGGGIACALGVSAGLVAAVALGHAVTWWLFAAAGVLAVVGLADDLLSLSAVPRLAAQATCGAVMGWSLGSSPAAAAVGVVVVVLAVNTTNFMDGINGISALTLTVWGLATTFAGARADSVPLTVLGAVTAGAALGFLPFNVPVARMFLGDSGSYLFGALVAAGCLLAWHESASMALVVAPLSLYLIDVLSTLVRRARARAPLMQAHRDHIYQRLLVRSGLPHVAVAGIVAGASALICVAWLAPWPLALAITTAIAAGYLAAPRWIGPVA